MNADEVHIQGGENVMDEGFHAQFIENIFHELVVDDMLGPAIIPNNPNLKGGRAPAGQ